MKVGIMLDKITSGGVPKIAFREIGYLRNLEYKTKTD